MSRNLASCRTNHWVSEVLWN